jgi:hypothetical protein
MGSDLAFMSFPILGLLALLAVLWFLLERHEKRLAAEGKPRLSGLQLFFASAALLTMLFSGGCGLLFMANMDGSYVTLPAILVLAGPPFAIGLVVWLLSRRRIVANDPAP